MPTGSYVRTDEHREAIRRRAIKRCYGKWMKDKTGPLSNNWKGGFPLCIDCNKILSHRQSKRCKKCNGKTKSGINNPLYGRDLSGENALNWKGGISKHKDYFKNLSKHRYNTDKNFRQKKLNSNRARRVNGKLPVKVIQKIFEENIKEYGTLTCYLCLKPIKFGNDHLEHKIPLSRNGLHNYSNLAIACSTCNLKKGSKTEEEYRAII